MPARAREPGLRVIVDIVPNPVAMGTVPVPLLAGRVRLTNGSLTSGACCPGHRRLDHRRPVGFPIMAALIDVPAFRDSIPSGIIAVADRLTATGAVGDLTSVGGGAQAEVTDDGALYLAWVGVVDRAFTGECDCDGPSDDDGFCAHAVAVALTSFDADVRFAAEADPYAEEPDHAVYQRAVRMLDPARLAALVVEHAERDRLFAARLLSAAGLLEHRSAVEVYEAVLQEVEAVTTGSRWEIADVEDAGRRLIAETEILCAGPAGTEALELVEEAIEIWDGLAGHLVDAYDVRRLDPEDVSDALAEARRDLLDR
ncbi:hypothetical protein GCM10010109_51350 [Actinoplanes campanulatus]|nr:hypothetical protein GCM10010109_51350 [Actinoplanes campanulatus]GID37320.1 hypothetical protein Aca09nite_38260 [Actinoplanes campanulatus]